MVETVQKSAVSEVFGTSENPKTTEIEDIILTDNYVENSNKSYEKSIKDKENEDEINE
jgi:hypothetical protein